MFKRKSKPPGGPATLDFNEFKGIANFFEDHPDPVYSLNLEGHLVSFNKKVSLILGATEKEILGQHYSLFLNPAERTRIAGYFQRVLNGETVHYNTYIRHKDGHVIMMAFTNIPIFHDHLIIGMYGVARDITKQTELRQKYTHLKLKQTMTEEIPGVSFFDFYPAEDRLEFSASFANLLGLSEKRMEGMSNEELMQRVHEDDRELFLSNAAMLATGDVDQFEIALRIRHLHNGDQHVICKAMLHNENPESPIISYAFHNLTELKVVTEERDSERQKLLEIYKTVNSAIYKKNLVTEEVEFYSKGFLDLFGIPTERFNADHAFWQKIIHQNDVPDLVRAHERVVKGEVTQVIYRIRINGQIKWVEEKRVPNFDESGQVVAFQSVANDITLIKEQQQEIWKLAMHDPITGLPNRTLLLEEIARLTELNHPFTVLSLSFNQLAEVNETFGYEIGDAWMVTTSEILQDTLPQGSYCGHLSGDQYIVILPAFSDENMLTKACEKLLTLSKKRFVVQSYELFSKVSVGVARYPVDAVDPHTLLKNSYTALSRAKGQEKSSYHLYSSNLDIEVFRRYQLETDLRRAVSRDQLFLEYQPKVDSWTGKIVGAEALIRWTHPEWGRIPPNDFIPLAEESDVHIAIGDWVLVEACRMLRQWIDDKKTVVPVSINVSPKRLFYGDFAEVVAGVLRRYSINPHLLEIEISETDILYENPKINETLHRIHLMGVKISLDDFGKGYSSISYLHRFPIDTIKIDRLFATHIHDDKKSKSIVKSVLFMAKEFGMSVVAEGVETLAQLDEFRELECGIIQGYLFSKPVPKDMFAVYLTQGVLQPIETYNGGTGSTPSVEAELTVTKLNAKEIHVGSSPVLVTKTNLKNVFFYSSIRLPVDKQIELCLTLQLNQANHQVRLTPVSIIELDNGLFQYEAAYLEMAQAPLVIDALQKAKKKDPVQVFDLSES
ncbi:sensor domain-containing protein [Exiguobacterium flavidum]|uniref:sensor domain-containing protein n=1 Tax=Exiguobacterium flavidum TaxID=2184695 RepID=UPI001E4F323A|nr:GGDEF domain-containing phosphodiesterase [Exiguobacterium flavidum]